MPSRGVRVFCLACCAVCRRGCTTGVWRAARRTLPMLNTEWRRSRMTRSAMLCEPEKATTPSLGCVDCGEPLPPANESGTTCEGCGRGYPIREGLLIAQDELTGKNRIAAAFYNSERWPRFRPWEQLFLKTLGGLPGARMQILRHLRDFLDGSLLD